MRTPSVCEEMTFNSDGTGNSPRVDIENYGCGGIVGPYACAACTTGGALLQAQFLNRVPFNSSDAWESQFPEMYRFWETYKYYSHEQSGLQLAKDIGSPISDDNQACTLSESLAELEIVPRPEVRESTNRDDLDASSDDEELEEYADIA